MIFGGLHVGLKGLYGVTLLENGHLVARASRRFRRLEELPDAYDSVISELSRIGSEEQPDSEHHWTLALEKPHRLLLAPKDASKAFVTQRHDVLEPSLAATVLGAMPQGPGLLISLGQEVRLALVDSTLQFREYRIQEGGGLWWIEELERLALHSVRLQTHLKSCPDGKPELRQVKQLLELGTYPSPDPVLKPRLEKIATKLATMAATLGRRLPGIKRFCISGFLSQSALGTLVTEELQDIAPGLRHTSAKFPPEVGASLMGLAQAKENWELSHLGKPLYKQDLSVDEWEAPKTLVRRLYRLRKPFEDYPS